VGFTRPATTDDQQAQKVAKPVVRALAENGASAMTRRFWVPRLMARGNERRRCQCVQTNTSPHSPASVMEIQPGYSCCSRCFPVPAPRHSDSLHERGSKPEQGVALSAMTASLGPKTTTTSIRHGFTFGRISRRKAWSVRYTPLFSTDSPSLHPVERRGMGQWFYY